MERLNLRKGTLLISSQGLFYRVVLFTDNDIILIGLHDGETLSMRNCLASRPASSDELYRLFLFNFRPTIYQVWYKVTLYDGDLEFKIVNVSQQNNQLVFEGVASGFNNGAPIAYQTVLTYSQLMKRNTFKI